MTPKPLWYRYGRFYGDRILMKIDENSVHHKTEHIVLNDTTTDEGLYFVDQELVLYKVQDGFIRKLNSFLDSEFIVEERKKPSNCRTEVKKLFVTSCKENDMAVVCVFGNVFGDHHVYVSGPDENYPDTCIMNKFFFYGIEDVRSVTENHGLLVATSMELFLFNRDSCVHEIRLHDTPTYVYTRLQCGILHIMILHEDKQQSMYYFAVNDDMTVGDMKDPARVCSLFYS